MFSKSASGELSKWQICVQFDRFHSLTIRVCDKCKNKDICAEAACQALIYTIKIMRNNNKWTRLPQPSYMVAAKDIK